MTITAPKKQIHDTHILFAGFAAIALVLALLAWVLPAYLGAVFNGPFGLFENVTVLFYALALALVMRRVARKVQAGAVKTWGDVERWILLAALIIVLIGEELQWLIPWLYEDSASWSFISLQGLVALSYAGVPEGASLKVIAAIAGLRIGAVLALIYALMGLYFYRARVQAALRVVDRAVIAYALGWAGLGFIALLVNAGKLSAIGALGECTEALAAAALLAAVSLVRPMTKKSV